MEHNNSTLSEEYGGFKHVASVQAYEGYGNTATNETMIVATDRVPDFGRKSNIEIPDKGKISMAISYEFIRFIDRWYNVSSAYCYCASTPFQEPSSYGFTKATDFDAIVRKAPELSGRFIIEESLQMLPIKCIVYGYLRGDAWELYKQGERTFCGVELPIGLKKGSKLEAPIIIPVEGEDNKITFMEMKNILSDTGMVYNCQESAEEICGLCTSLYEKASKWTLEGGVVVSETELRFGLDCFHDICVHNTLLAPDSSSFWRAEDIPSEESSSYNTPNVAEYMAGAIASGTVNPIPPDDIIEKDRQLLIELCERLSGKIYPTTN